MQSKLTHRRFHSKAEEESLTASLDLLRRLPPQKVSQNLDSLVTILPDLGDDLLSSVDQPLRVVEDRENGGKEYLVSSSFLSLSKEEYSGADVWISRV